MIPKQNIKHLIKKSGLIPFYYAKQERISSLYKASLLRLSPVLFVKNRYRGFYGKEINLKQPATFDEKLLWLMLYWKHPLKTYCGDKYTMRLYVQEQGWGHILPELLRVYENSSEINFDELPEKFALKCTHGCGSNIICKDKTTLDKIAARKQLDIWMKIDYSRTAGELHYASMKPRIICEQFLEDLDRHLPVDYKVYCFGGKVHCTLIVQERGKPGQHALYDYYDRDWNVKLPYSHSTIKANRVVPKPEGYEQMIAAAEALSKPFPFVRMDFYSIGGKAILGEMTFTPSGCIDPGYTKTGQHILGSLIELPETYKGK